MQKEKFISAAVIFLSAAIISAFTAVSLIFFDVADYVYLNIIGLFIICVYFGFAASIFYLVGFTGFMIKFGLADAFFSYSLVLGVVNAAIIAFYCKREVKFRKILVASVGYGAFFKDSHERDICLAIRRRIFWRGFCDIARKSHSSSENLSIFRLLHGCLFLYI
ncbi:hypothetical protein [Campylobacter concisus]|uniref:hypothetical protein n=1 Tax=Campylobacter concisus TaxID=199 RepID=UPI00131D8A37|nr:hypothetical protein [Campylobacter concisus]